MTAQRDTLHRVRRLAWLLDNSIPLPGLRFRIGVEAILGLIPRIGDALGVAASNYILREAWRLGVPRSVLLRMGLNVAIEGAVGAVPLLGDVFDAAWKANLRNVALLEAHANDPRGIERASAVAVSAVIAGVLLATLAVFVAVAWLIATVVRARLCGAAHARRAAGPSPSRRRTRCVQHAAGLLGGDGFRCGQ